MKPFRWRRYVADWGETLFTLLRGLVYLCLPLYIFAAIIGILYGGIPKLFTMDFLIICAAIPASIIMLFALLLAVGAAVMGVAKLFGKHGKRFLEWLNGDD
jgi:hypothetical protein